MKKFKNFAFFILFFVSFAFLVPQALAGDLTVTCGETDCVMTPSPGAPLFEESDVKPGDNFSQTITVINNREEECLLRMWTEEEDDLDGFGSVLFTAINDGVNDFFGTTDGGQASSDKNLQDLFAAGDVSLGAVAASGTNVYNWLVGIDVGVGNEYQEKSLVFDFKLNFACGEPTPPELVITKDNDKKGQVLSSGAIVTYTLTVTNNGPGPAYDVVVEDVQPVGEYFDYLEGSGTLKLEPSGPVNPIAATHVGGNRYLWPIGDVLAGETYTLKYQLKILNISIPGTHHNIAFARGEGEDGDTYYSDPVLDPIQVGRESLSAGYSGEVLGVAVAKVGEVLGAATGSPTFWLFLSLLMVLAGTVLKSIKKKKSAGMPLKLFLALGLSGTILIGATGVAMAADTQAPVIAIVKLPDYFNKRDFEISYTALDGGEAGLKNVHLEYKKEGESWQDLGTYTESSRKVSVDSGKINEDAKFFFKATACDNANNCASSETSTKIDTSAPPKPENYSKEKIGIQSYKIKWHNPDSDDLDKVYIYRSDKRDFDANDSTKVNEKSVSKNTDSEWTDPVVPDSSKEYYYVLRSVDKAGNASDPVGETYTTYVTGEEGVTGVPAGEEVSGEEVIAGQEPVVQEEVSEAEEGEAEATPEGQILGGEAEEAAPEERKKIPWKWLLIIAAGLAGVSYWFFKTKEEKK